MCEQLEVGRGGRWGWCCPPPLPFPVQLGLHHRRPQAQSGFGKPKSGLMEPWAGGQAAIDPPLGPRSPSYLSIALRGRERKDMLEGKAWTSGSYLLGAGAFPEGWSLAWGEAGPV